MTTATATLAPPDAAADATPGSLPPRWWERFGLWLARRVVERGTRDANDIIGGLRDELYEAKSDRVVLREEFRNYRAEAERRSSGQARLLADAERKHAMAQARVDELERELAMAAAAAEGRK